jgi:hypothetical protein
LLYLCIMTTFPPLPENFNPASRVWIYQSSRPFTPEESNIVNQHIDQFTQQWLSHGSPVKGWGTLHASHFIILMADETATGVSGCSTDSSVHLVKKMEAETGNALFNRTELAFLIHDEIQIIPLAGLAAAITAGTITAETPYFNNLITTLSAMRENWMIPAKNSWMGKKYFAQQKANV